MFDILGGIFTDLIFRRIIVGIFGYYTLWAFYKITRNEEALKLLDAPATDGVKEFDRGCLINIVGLIAFCAFITLIVYLFY